MTAAPEPADPITPAATDSGRPGLSLAPLRGLRPQVDADRLGRMLCPPYDVIDDERRRELLAGDPDNAVAVILPDPTPAGYAQAAATLDHRVSDGVLATDPDAVLYVYEMTDRAGGVTRGLLGALELRDPADGVILPHENTMAGPVADRLAVMTATGTDLEPIYLVYEGGGPASQLVAALGGTTQRPALAEATDGDGVRHRLWAIQEQEELQAVAADLAGRHALIADGHHRYATYRERQRLRHETDGPGPWDRGLALLVDTREFGPQVHAIHRVVAGLTFDDALRSLRSAGARVGPPAPLVEADAALAALGGRPGFAMLVTDGSRLVAVDDPAGRLAAIADRPGEPAALAGLDVTVLHRTVVESVWGLADDEATVGYAHSVADAIGAAEASGGLAVLLRPTPVEAVAEIAAAGARMPRKSTLFTPKPASGLVMRRLVDQV